MMIHLTKVFAALLLAAGSLGQLQDLEELEGTPFLINGVQYRQAAIKKTALGEQDYRTMQCG